MNQFPPQSSINKHSELSSEQLNSNNFLTMHDVDSLNNIHGNVNPQQIIIPKDQKYSVHFKIFYETIPGEDLYVIGDLPDEDGSDEFKIALTWTDGHIWVTKKPFVTQEPCFTYKYIVLEYQTDRLLNEESGISRIADLHILAKE